MSAAAIAGAGSLKMVLEILANVATFANNPETLAWLHHLLVRSTEAQAKLDLALAAEKHEPDPKA